jgi:hypothetical protein
MKLKIDKIFPDSLLQAIQPPNDSSIDLKIIQCAAEWMARLWSGEANDADKAAWQRWFTVHPNHERAWDCLQKLLGWAGKFEKTHGSWSIPIIFTIFQSLIADFVFSFGKHHMPIKRISN